ncbi:MAG TPA: hypothetical protein VJK04_00310 [Candidatus Paceibacterota bacterium]
MNSLESLILAVLEAKAVEIRDVDHGEKPFLYSSGNLGPGYIMMKGLVGRKDILKPLVREHALKVVEFYPNVGFVAGNVSGGVIPGWILSEELESLLGRSVPYVYVRETRKKGGQKELITGVNYMPQGSEGLIVEELVNFAQTTVNSAEVVRSAGFTVTHAACILFYGNPESIKSLNAHDLEMIYLFTLPELLEVAERHGTHTPEAIQSFRDFLRDPLEWQQKVRKLMPNAAGGTK